MKKIAIVLLVVFILICAFGSYALKSKMSAKDPNGTKPTTVVSSGNIEVDVIDSGTIEAEHTVEIKSRVQGRLKKLYVNEGDHVKAGQLVALIDPEETQLQVQQDAAVLRGAQSVYDKSGLQIKQRRISAEADYKASLLNLEQLKEQAAVQPKLTKAAIDQAQNQLDSSKADLKLLQQSSIPTQRASSKAALEEAVANLANAQAQYNRDKDLLAKGFVSTKQFEDSTLQLNLSVARLNSAKESDAKLNAQFDQQLAKAKFAVEQAQANLDSANANGIQDKIKKQQYLNAINDRNKAIASLQDIGIMEQDKVQSASTVSQNQTTLKNSERLLGYTEVRSPIDGIVTKKEIQEGELVASLSSFSSGTAIIRIEDRTSMRVTLDVNEIDVAKLKQGMYAQVAIDALSGKSFSGSIESIAPGSTSEDTATSSTPASTDSVVKYQVKVKITHPDPSLRSGMSAKCTFAVQKATNVLSVPLEFIGKDATGSFLMVAAADKKLPPTKTPVILGMTDGSITEIKSGVKNGTTILRPDFKGPAMKGMMEIGGGS